MHSTGTKRKHCSPECRVKWQIARAKARKPNYPECSVDGCASPAVRVGAGMCEKHYGRVRRGVDIHEDRKPTYRYVRTSGYINLLIPGHPIADKNGVVGEHRVVMYDLHRGVCPSCFWCGTKLDWASAVVDHLNEDKQDNSRKNLVVSCNGCNRARGGMLPFVGGMRPEALPVFIKQIMEYRAGLGIAA